MQKTSLPNRSLSRTWTIFREFSEKIDFNPWVFLAPALLGLLAALAEGVSVGLLIPAIQGVLEKSFVALQQKPFLKQLLGLLPGNISQSNAAIFSVLVLLIFFFAMVKNMLGYISSTMTIYQAREFANRTRKKIYVRFLSFGKLFFDRASAGHLHQILVGYTQQVSQELNVLENCLTAMFSLIVYIAIAFSISWKLTLFSALIFPILHYSVQALLRKIKASSEHFAQAYSEMGKRISNALSCIMLVKAYSNEEREKEWFFFTSDRVRNFQFSIDKKQLFFVPFQEIVGLCMVLLLVAAMAFLLIREKSGEVAGFLVFFVVLRRASSGFGVFNRARSTLAGLRGPLQEIRQVFDDEGKSFVIGGERVFTGLKDRIEFKGLSFGYVDDRSVLKGVDLFIRKNETVAIIGASGSGKTTLINLLMRFYDVPPATLFIDGTDIREFTLSSSRSKMALVSQDTYILNAPFRFNLVYGLDRKVSDLELESVLERAQLLPLVKQIGIQAELGDRGVKLSGGERQRISIARAMLKNPEILILDEATSALDTTTEGLVRTALEGGVAGKTVIVIAHRLSTIRSAGQIVMLDHGRVIEKGTLDELLKREGEFKRVWAQQQFF